MKIKIFNEKDIQTFITDEDHIVISIQDPNNIFVSLPEQKSRKGCLQLQFFDMDEDTGQFPYSRFIFNHYHTQAILAFVESYKKNVDFICINCVAGISRSAGIAAALSNIYNTNDEYFFNNYIPNRLIYRTILNKYHENIGKNNKL